MLLEIRNLKKKYGHISNVIVDSANPEIIQSLKRESWINERYDEQYIHDKILWCKKNNSYLENHMIGVPKSFAAEGKQVLQHAAAILDSPSNLLVIPPRFEK